MQVDYLKIGDKVYAVQEIQAKGIDINAELKEFYDQRHGQLAEEFGQVLNSNMQEEWNAQIAHLRKFEERGAIKVPDNMFGKLIMVYNNRLLPCRVVVYSPTDVAVSLNWLKGRIERGKITFTRQIWEGFEDNDELTLTLKPLFAVPLVVAFDSKADQIYTPFQKTYHTMGGMNLCTGNNKASDFWKLDDMALQRELNRINTFSPATHSIRANNLDYSFSNIMTNDTIIEVKDREVTSWRT